MSIQTHLELLLDKYGLRNLYYKYIITNVFNVFIGDSFYWSSLYGPILYK